MAPKEYDLLFMLIRNRNIAVSKEKSSWSEIWGYDYYGDDRTIDTHIKLLRRSLRAIFKLYSNLERNRIQIWGLIMKFDINRLKLKWKVFGFSSRILWVITFNSVAFSDGFSWIFLPLYKDFWCQKNRRFHFTKYWQQKPFRLYLNNFTK